jgi:hypothetical protein
MISSPKHGGVKLRTKASKAGKKDLWLIALLLPGLICGLILGVQRHNLEQQNRTVELVLDYSEVQSLATTTNTPILKLLARLKSAGITGVAISEDILGDLSSLGQISLNQLNSGTESLTVIRIPDKQLANRIIRAVNKRIPNLTSTSYHGVTHQSQTIVVHAPPGVLKNMGIGLPPEAVNVVKQAGLDVVARLQNHPALTKKSIDVEIDELKKQGIVRLICAGDEVLGFRGLIPYTAKTIKSNSLIYGSIEFAKQKGDTQICKELDARFIRVHSIPYSEMATIAPSTAIERFVRAVKERGIRLCYIRLPEISSLHGTQNNFRFISRISSNIKSAGYKIGTANLMGNMSRPTAFLILIGLATTAGTILLLNSMFTLPSKYNYILLIFGTLLASGCVVAGEIGRKIVALAVALVFPTWGVIASIGPYFSAEKFHKLYLLKTIGILIKTSFITLCGAVLIIGLLADRSYMMKVNEFSGIKVAHLLPLLGVIIAMAVGLPMINEPWPNVQKQIKYNARQIANHPLFVWHAAATVLALGILVFAIMRTGNDPRIAVSEFELKFRALLDHLLGVRPRTKEFLIGHPALFIGIALLLTQKRAWGLPLVALGVLGQVSLLNTFCHIHMPLKLSITRALIGLGLGTIIGMALFQILPGAKAKDTNEVGRQNCHP